VLKIAMSAVMETAWRDVVSSTSVCASSMGSANMYTPSMTAANTTAAGMGATNMSTASMAAAGMTAAAMTATALRQARPGRNQERCRCQSSDSGNRAPFPHHR
jgi:hypothetical protein